MLGLRRQDDGEVRACPGHPVLPVEAEVQQHHLAGQPQGEHFPELHDSVHQVRLVRDLLQK